MREKNGSSESYTMGDKKYIYIHCAMYDSKSCRDEIGISRFQPRLFKLLLKKKALR